MHDWELSRLHWAGKLAITAFLCAVGVGFIFSTMQVSNQHGGISYRTVVESYYGEPVLRDSLDQYWAGAERDLVAAYSKGEAPEGPHAALLRQARSEAHLRYLIDERHQRDLLVYLGIPGVKALVSLAHTHTFGHVAFLFPVSLIVLLTGLPWTWKGLIAAAPHVGVILDYPSAIATRVLAPEFAAVLIFAGALMGLGYLAGFVVTVYDLWFRKPDAAGQSSSSSSSSG